MLRNNFDIAEFVYSESVPTLLAQDPKSSKILIGQAAEEVSRAFQPVIQNFKQAVGESDAMFEGRYLASRSSRPERRWIVGYTASAANSTLSTREVTKLFLEGFLGTLGPVPKQFIIGIPSVKDKTWPGQYRAHLNSVLVDLGYDPPTFFPEPFAVFQYYRHVEQLIPSSRRPLAVLVIDFGGGTVDSCVIETTNEGNLSRGGSTAVPLGVQAFFGAGKELDKRLFTLCIKRSPDPKLHQDSVDARIASRPWVLLAIEKMKISLSKKMQHARLEHDCAMHVETLNLPKGTYHPDLPLSLQLNGEDLKKTIKDLWFDKNGIGASVLATVTEARFRGGQVQLQQLDKVILGGGSSKLPFLKELVVKTLAGLIPVSQDDVLIGKHSERAVAYGIAIEAAEDKKKALRTHNSVGPCVFSQLFLFAAPRRREPAIKPKVRFWQSKDVSALPDGTLLSGPMQIEGFTLEYLVDLPYRPHGSLFYWFTDESEQSDPEASRLNIEQDVLRLPPKAQGKFRLRLSFDPDRGLISPTFLWGDSELPGAPFLFSGLRLKKDVSSYIGLDFGTSNSYAVILWGAIKEHESTYPVFTINDLAGERLRILETRIASARAAGRLTAQAAHHFSVNEQAVFVFHSVKLEGNKLSFGETEALLDGRQMAVSKEMLEPVNVRDAYNFAIENAEYLRKAPESFVRELHGIVVKGISADGGKYRREPVSISGMNFSPPDWTEVEPFMARFSDELKISDQAKSVIQQAAEAHSTFTSIHPFNDGNGRTARLIMNAILTESGLPAIVIAYSDKGRYLDALASSNKGDISELCILFGECIEAALEQMRGNTGVEEGVTVSTPEEKPLSGWVPSQELAEIMSARLERAPLMRQTRYESWAAAFESLREDFGTTCAGFNEAYGDALYHTGLARYDRVPYEKYHDLLRRKPVPKTWLMGIEINSDIKSERFVFWFRHMSVAFQKLCRESRPPKQIPPSEVTLSVSRRVGGTFQPLRDEPIRLREIAYVNGDWLVLLFANGQSYEIVNRNPSSASLMFLQDSIAAYL